MRPCPKCLDVPSWYFARRVSEREKVRHFILRGCVHAEAFGLVAPKQVRFVPRNQIGEQEALWDAHAEALFIESTTHWKDHERTAFRARIFPEPVRTQLFPRHFNEPQEADEIQIPA